MIIAFVIDSFFPYHRAGTEVYVLNLCNHLIQKGWNVHVIISSSTDQKNYIYEGIPIHTFVIPEKPDVKELNGLMPPRGIDHFLEVIAEIKPVLIHFHSFGRAINGFHLEAVKKLGIKTAFTPHLGSLFCIKGDLRLNGTKNCNGKVLEARCLKCLLLCKGYSSFASSLFSKIVCHVTKFPVQKLIIPASFNQAKHRKKELERINKFADIIFAIAPWIDNAFKENGINHSILIPQGISPLFFEKHSSTLKSKNNKINFAFIGRMHSSKGFHLLRQAWEAIENEKGYLHVLTNPSGGEIEYFESNKNWALSQNNVIWNQGLTQIEVAKYFPKIDVLLLPSISNEVAPLVILEAAIFNIPTIGSDYIAIKDMITHERNGLLFRNGNFKDLANQIQRVIYDREYLEQLKMKVFEPTSMEKVAAIIEQEYIKLL